MQIPPARKIRKNTSASRDANARWDANVVANVGLNLGKEKEVDEGKQSDCASRVIVQAE
jgi:hypothetical protein